MCRKNITKAQWKEISDILNKYKIPYTMNFRRRDVQRAMEQPDLVVMDKHIQINLVIPNYYNERQ